MKIKILRDADCSGVSAADVYNQPSFQTRGITRNKAARQRPGLRVFFPDATKAADAETEKEKTNANSQTRNRKRKRTDPSGKKSSVIK